MNVFSKLVVCIGVAFVTAGAHAQNVHGVLRVVKGDVQVKTSKGEITKARIGGKVFPKDVVITGKDARAKIVMVDNNEINVSPESQVEIQHYEYDPAGGKKDVLLNVIYGKVRSKVEQKYDGKTSKFQIKTPSAVAGVRGTDFMMGFNRADRSSQVVTFEGRVEFGVPGPGGTIGSAVFVTPGMTAAVSAGNAPSVPAPMAKEELAKIDKDSSAETPKAKGPDAPANDQRTPAGDDKKDGKKGEGPKGDGAKAEGGAGAPVAGSGGSAGGEGKDGQPQPGPVVRKDGEKRGPASDTPKTECTMCGAPSGPPPPPPIAQGPPIFKPPEVPRIGDDQRVRDTIKGGNTNLIIRVK